MKNLSIYLDILAYIFDIFAVGRVILARFGFWHSGCKSLGVGNNA